MNKKKRKFHFFTLIELIVAMSVFSILLLLLLQFYTGAQKMWTSQEKRNNLYADARVSMDLMSTLLSNTFYAVDATPFVFVQSNGESGTSAVYFAAKTNMQIGGVSQLRYVTFQQIGNDLKMGIFCDEEREAFENSFPPFVNGNDYSKVAKSVQDQLNTNISGTQYGYVILRNIINFKMTAYPVGSTSSSATMNTPPGLIEITLTLLDPESYKEYQTMKASKNSDVSNKAESYADKNKYTFTRAVYLGARTAL